MLKRIKILLITLLIGFSPYLLFAEQLENKTVERIDVLFVDESGETEYNPKYVLTKLRTRASDLFSQSDFDSDLKDLATNYDYVEPSIEVIDTNLYITLKIWPKPVIRSIQWQGNCKLTTTTLCEEMGLRSGSLFDRAEFNRAFQKIRAYYIKQGFFEAETDYSVDKDPNCNEVDITISIREGRSGKIKRIIFEGFNSCEQEAIIELMYTKEYSWLMSWFSSDGVYNEEAIQVDQFRILNYLHDLGYADAEVDIDVCEANQSDRIVIYIRANRGECYCVESLSFEGNHLFDQETIERQFCIEEGSAYSPELIRQSIKQITDLYGRYGYIDAVVDYEAHIVEEGCGYRIKFFIEEGEQFRVGLVKVYGNFCTNSRVILHESLMIPGELFNIDKLKKTEERLINIGYFKCVNVYIAGINEQLSTDCQYRDVHIEVEEQGTGNFGAFFGYSTTEQLFCGINITEKNFNHAGLLSCWSDGLHSLRGGGEFLYLTTNIGQKARSYSLSWTQPYFNDTPWSVGVDLEKSWVAYVSESYQINAIGGSLHASYPLDPYTRFGCHYRLRDTDVDVKDSSALLNQEAAHSGLISAVGVSLNFDSTNSPSCPSKGFRSRMELEYVGLGGKHQFWGFAYLNTLYTPFGKKAVIKLRADCRFLLPPGRTYQDEIPLDERLYLGGDNQVRGYRPYAIGPKFPGTNNPRGGISLALLSAEYSLKLASKLDGFFFLDGGELARARLFVGDINWSVGYGIRLKVFENGPPLCMGMGYPLNAKDKSDEKRFFWTLGGRF